MLASSWQCVPDASHPEDSRSIHERRQRFVGGDHGDGVGELEVETTQGIDHHRWVRDRATHITKEITQLLVMALK